MSRLIGSTHRTMYGELPIRDLSSATSQDIDGIPRNAKIIRLTLSQVKVSSTLLFRVRVNGSTITSASYNHVFHYGFDNADSDSQHDTNAGTQNGLNLSVIGNWGASVFHSGLLELVKVSDFKYSGSALWQHYGYNQGGGQAMNGCFVTLSGPITGLTVEDTGNSFTGGSAHVSYEI
tara:strand:+ start:81 stop:611 length:531 start_codon:yes stop_codon:yes gene_type:complete